MFVTAPVAASTYLASPTLLRGQPRTHLVEIGVDGFRVEGVARVLCNRVKPTSILEDGSMWTEDRPTCPTCAKKWDALKNTK